MELKSDEAKALFVRVHALQLLLTAICRSDKRLAEELRDHVRAWLEQGTFSKLPVEEIAEHAMAVIDGSSRAGR